MIKKVARKLTIQQPLVVALIAFTALGAGYGVAHAMLTGGGDIISPPAVIADDEPGATNRHQQAFTERQAVELPSEIRCNNTILPAGEVVNSHMIFFNTPFNSPETDANRTWTFDDEIVCVMSNGNGLYQAVTDGLLGAPGTTYPGPFAGRGLEGDDSYSVSGNSITVTMTAEEPGDWMRVLTKVPVPDDITAPVVYCDTIPANDKKNDIDSNRPFYTLIGADETDGEVDLFLTDNTSGTTFGPYSAGTQIQLQIAKGATPAAEPGNNKVDYKIKANGAVTISATDEAGNVGSASCAN